MSTETKKEKETAISEAGKPSNFFARQPLSVLEKIAFWGFVVGLFAGLGGAITLTITSGTPSRDIIITMACALVSAGVLATRFRWAPLVSTVVGGYNLYLLFTEPYAIASLIDPKGPNGGFGKFVGIVIILAITIVAFGCSIGAAVQNYRQGSRKAPRWLPAALTLVAGMIIGALFIGALSHPPVPAGTTYTNGMPTVHLSETSFAQTSVTIARGSKLILVDDTPVVHILDNGFWQNGTPDKVRETGAPLVNNVQLSGNSVEIGPFTTAGTYHIFCIVHQGMNLTITVQ